MKHVGARRRIFGGATRRAVEVRDRECYSEFCDTTAEECEVDHVVPWALGGPTVESNGRLACGYHNRHRRSWPRRRPASTYRSVALSPKALSVFVDPGGDAGLPGGTFDRRPGLATYSLRRCWA